MEQTLADVDLDRRLQRDGFVVLPLAGDGVTAAGHDGLDEATEAAVARLFPSYTVRSSRLVRTAPGEAAQPEPTRGGTAGRSLRVWMAVDDIDGHNGQLRVLRSSHLIPAAEADDAPSWLRHVDVIEPRLLSVPLSSGEAVVFDDALVRCTYPNLTDRTSVAAELLLTRDAGDAADGTSAIAPGASGGTDLTPEELAERLDQGALALVDRVARRRAELARRATTSAKGLGGRAATRTVAAREAVARTAAGARAHAPSREKLATWWAEAPSKAAMAVLRVNEAYIDRFGPEHPVVWDHHQFEWSHRVEAAWPDVLAEVQGLLAGPTDIPHIEDVTGGIPQGNIGPWRSFVLMHQGHWIDWNCARCPRTTELVRTIPGLTLAGFSVLEPGTHITTHRGPNKGALRYQLGVIVPGEEGACRIRVGDEMLIWRDGEGVMFDFTIPHEAWNDSDGIRVLLMLELLTPMPWYIDAPNRVAQRAMGWFPTTRNLKARLGRLEPELRRPEPAA